MAVTQHQELLLDPLFCEEVVEQWDDEEEEDAEDEDRVNTVTAEDDHRPINGLINVQQHPLLPLMLLDQDLFWDDEELLLMFAKEEKNQQDDKIIITTENHGYDDNEHDGDECGGGGGGFGMRRKEAVEWMIRVNEYHGFSNLTAILSINYLDRFLSTIHFQKDKPWMIQLAAVACLSLAAKVEESHVPLLIHLQVAGSSGYLFDGKTIQKMELLVLSSLQWKMHSVTPFSFLDHIIRRLGLKTHVHAEFLRRCERLLLSVISDSKFFGGYRPSVMAVGTMLHVIDQIEPLRPFEYQNQLLGLLSTIKGKAIECYNLIAEAIGSGNAGDNAGEEMKGTNKRKYDEVPRSPSGVIDGGYLSYESSNDSWAVVGSSVSSSPVMAKKKSRVEESEMMPEPVVD